MVLLLSTSLLGLGAYFLGYWTGFRDGKEVMKYQSRRK